MIDLVLHGGVLVTPPPPSSHRERSEAPGRHRERSEATGSHRERSDAVWSVRHGGLAISGGRIAAVGSDADMLALAGPGTRKVNLGGRTVLPGFIDAHAHIWKIGHLLTTMADLRRTGSLAEIAARVREAPARLRPDGWVLARGYNEARLAERRPPTREDLDAVVPDRPVVLTRTCGHIYACNSLALRLCGIGRETPDPPGGVIGRDASGEPTGLLHETAMGLVNARMPAPTADEYATMIGAALRHQLSHGITSTNDAGVSPSLLEVYRNLDASGRLPSRVNVMALRRVEGTGIVPLPEMHVSDRLRIDTVKFLADGGLSGATAALSVPYRHADTRGVLRFADDELLSLSREAHEAGWRIATHAIGDVTIDQVLRTYEALGPGPKRHRIEHLGLPTAGHLSRAARLGVIAVPQSIFLYELGRNFRAFLPDHLLAVAYPIRSMLDAGLTVALSSDAPVVEDDSPLRGIEAAVMRLDAEGHPIAADQGITIAEAIAAYTTGGAVASGDEDNRGCLTPGAWADLAVLSGNPLDTPAEALTDLVVEQTWVGGTLAYER
ncbi:MAG: Amidohydrolase 3 [Gemmatimonadetes bacterium]|nr:Amidohydrolase 3 [Gemmatimonadota bacterium]